MLTRRNMPSTVFHCLTLAIIILLASSGSARAQTSASPAVAVSPAQTSALAMMTPPAAPFEVRVAPPAVATSSITTTPPATAPDAPPAGWTAPIAPASAPTFSSDTPAVAVVPPALTTTGDSPGLTGHNNAANMTVEPPPETGVPLSPPAAVAPATSAAPTISVAPQQAPVNVCQGKTTVRAEVVALAQSYMLNRMGASIPNGLVFALKRDVVKSAAGQVQLRPGKRARPIVLRVNQGDCLQIDFTNLITPYPPPAPTATAVPATPEVSIHIQGMQAVKGIADDGSFVGQNGSSLTNLNASRTYTLYAEAEGTFLLATMGDTSSTGQGLVNGLFGAVNVQPAGAEWYRSQVTAADLKLATKGATADGHPILDYAKLYPANYPIVALRCTPILKMSDVQYAISNGQCAPVNAPANKVLQLYHTDLTAVVTGPNAGRFPGTTGVNNEEPDCDKIEAGAAGDPLFCRNPALPDRKQPYREITIIYHEVNTNAVQAFPIFKEMPNTMAAGIDGFAINYGTGGIGAEIFANRVGVGPMGDCVDCRYEEFFLSAWAVGDPAMLVDKPANTPLPAPAGSTTNCFNSNSFNTAPCGGTTTKFPDGSYAVKPLKKATIAFFPDDPSNVYHSYLSDHVKYRILHGGIGVSHVHHQHAQQWLQSPNSDKGAYLDSQMISPGASYTLEMVYGGSGNRNKTMGDSIFHCHFYPHFAGGMWSMWRVHDVFEAGTALDKNGRPAAGARALPDGEISAGTPIPALVPMPTLAMAPLPSPVFIKSGQIVYGTPAAPDPTGANVKTNPGYPFFIPGLAGARAPHPPFDFAPDGSGGQLDGGLPRHIVTGGTVSNEKHTAFDWSKDLATANARQLPEKGTPVENVAIDFNRLRLHPSFTPDGSPAKFQTNGLPNGPQLGAPYADPGVRDDGSIVTDVRRYKTAAMQLNITLNRKGWHFPQQRILALWQDVLPTYNYTPGGSSGRQPEPLFVRANSDEVVEFWHTNLVPDYYLVDDFQVRTPTDIIGQHIHLVKFDVTSSDGAANGFNYEDGTFSPEEVQHKIAAIKKGTWTPIPGGPAQAALAPKAPPSDIINCAANPADPRCAEWSGAQTTVQRWFVDKLLDDAGRDRTMRTVFTHDHFGPSTHQQAGLYAAVAIEPQGSVWRNSETGQIMGGANVPPVRPDGGPTSWKADILTADSNQTYREFLLEFQDFQLAYSTATLHGTTPRTMASLDPAVGWRDPTYAISPPPTPQLVSTGFAGATPGTQSVNYLNEPTPWRIAPQVGDFSDAFDSSFKIASNSQPNGDPATPLMRAYEGDRVQVRTLVGAHMFSHFFNIHGLRWLAEPTWLGAGYRSSQAMGLSEHFEMLFDVPPTSSFTQNRKCPDKTNGGNCADYFYSPSLDDTGIANGMWGIFRAYDTTAKADNLQPLPNNPIGNPVTPAPAYTTCPANAPVRSYNVTAVAAQKALPSPDPGDPKGKLVFNNRGLGAGAGTPASILRNRFGLLYVFSKDLDANGKLKAGVPVEPLILRANAGDCITVKLTNAIDPTSDIYTDPAAKFTLPAPFNLNVTDPSGTSPLFTFRASKRVGLHPQLLSYDVTDSDGINVGYNRKDQLVGKGDDITYTWYAGTISRGANGALVHTPVEFGSLNLFPGDPLLQHINGLFGALVVEPAGAIWQCGDGAGAQLANCDPDTSTSPGAPPTTRASATISYAKNGVRRQFREFVVMTSDDLKISANNTGAVNYRTEPVFYRYGHNRNDPKPIFAADGDNSCALSNQLVKADPQTPIFKANPGVAVRFRMLHPMGTGTVQVFSLHGHVWQRNPYTNDSTEIGNNPVSQWMGSRDSYGATDHADIVIDKAGGENAVAGDYLYTVFLPNQSQLGAWGIFRVGNGNSGPQPVNQACIPKAPIATPALTTPTAPQPASDTDRLIRQPITRDDKP